MKTTKLVLVDDHVVVRKGLAALLNETDGIEVVGEAGNGKEAIQEVEKLKPDIVIMDISLPILNGLEATRRIKKRYPDIHILALTMHTNEEYIFELIRAGASGYVVKKVAPCELIFAIQTVMSGEFYFSPSVSTKMVKRFLDSYGSKSKEKTTEILTSRETEILQMIAEGYSNREIADKLFISVKTVQVHKTNMMKKLDLTNTTALIKYAIQKGIIQLD